MRGTEAARPIRRAKRIVVVHGRYRSTAPSGENHVVDQETAALRELGHEVVPFERHSDDIAGWPLREKALLPLRAVWNAPVGADLARTLARVRPDVVHVHNTFPVLSPAVLQACADAGVPVVATLHNYKLLCASGDFFRDGAPCHDCAAGRLGPALRHGCYRGSRAATVPVVVGLSAHRDRWREQVSAFILISAAQRSLLGGLDLPADRVFVKHNFVPDRVRPQAGRDTEGTEAVVTYVGRLDEAKGVPFLMTAWDRFRAERPDAALRLRVVGGGPLEERVSSWASGRPDVEVLGLVPRDEAARLLAGSRAAVVPSQWEETFGLVAVEAMAAGTPPLVPDRGSFPELVRDGEDALVYRAGDPASLAAALGVVADRPEQLMAIGHAARAAYETRHRAADNVARLAEIYDYAIAHRIGGELRVG